eukprot:sb/3474747/
MEDVTASHRKWGCVMNSIQLVNRDVVIYRLVKNPECKACWGVSQVGSRLQRVLCKSRDKMCREQYININTDYMITKERSGVLHNLTLLIVRSDTAGVFIIASFAERNMSSPGFRPFKIDLKCIFVREFPKPQLL